MVQTHQDSCQEGTTTPFLPQDTEKIWHMSSDPQKVLQLHHREHPYRFGNCSASNRKALQKVVSTAQYITGAKLPDIQDLYTKNCQTPVTQVIDCSLCYRTASVTGAPSLGPNHPLVFTLLLLAVNYLCIVPLQINMTNLYPRRLTWFPLYLASVVFYFTLVYLVNIFLTLLELHYWLRDCK